PRRGRREARSEDVGHADARVRRDAEAVIEAERVFKRGAGRVVESGDDVRVEEAVSALRSGRAGRVVLEDDARRGEIGVLRGGGELVRVVGDFGDEGLELRGREAFAVVPREIARAGRRVAADVAGDDLTLRFVALLFLGLLVDREDVVELGDLRNVGR